MGTLIEENGQMEPLIGADMGRPSSNTYLGSTVLFGRAGRYWNSKFGIGILGVIYQYGIWYWYNTDSYTDIKQHLIYICN